MMKRVLNFLCALLMVAALLPLSAGCGVTEEAELSSIVVGYSTPSLQNSFWISVTSAMQRKADKLGVRLSIRDAASDTAKQAADIEDLIQQRVDVLLVTPYDSVSLAPAIRLANEAGIPVIIVDIGINDPNVKYESLIITDNYTGGRMAGEWLMSYFRDNRIGNPTVATIEAQLGAENARERHNGFIDVMAENGIDVVLGRSANSLRDMAMEVMEDFLQTYPNLTAVFAECDDMALGALQAVKQARASTIIVGYDGNIAACEQILLDTNLKADIDQRPGEMGELAVQMAVDLMNGINIEDEVSITPELITRENVEEFIRKFNENR
jgi:ABC-type sugar transport system substrate-binding protein